MTDLYNDKRIRVYTNSSGEIFIEDKRKPDATIRIAPTEPNGFNISTHGRNCVLTPSVVRGWKPAIHAGVRE